MREFVFFLLCAFGVLGMLVFAHPAHARSVYTPRDSGTEPPGGPRAPMALPQTGNFGRTPDGGMGYTDAYGNPLRYEEPKPKPHKRPAHGAFAPKQEDPYARPLPDPMSSSKRPAWSF